MSQQEGSSRTAHLNKGKACFNCRRRKVKCDAKRPICTPCSQFIRGGLQDCEYTEKGPAESQVLEEKISILESRIQEMERPYEPRTTVGLHNPYRPGHHRSASSPTGFQQSNPVDLMARVGSLTLFQALIKAFIPHATNLGFFLNPHLFDGLAHGAAPSQLASSALLDAVYLWGAHLSRGGGPSSSASLAAHEPRLLSVALHSASVSLTRAHTPAAVLHALQAHVLLAAYLFRAARGVEGTYHAGVAMSIALGAGLHKVRARGFSGGGGSGRRSGSAAPVNADAELSPAVCAAEEGERINAFWAVVAMNACWLAAGQDGGGGAPGPAGVDYGTVDTPWPLEIEAYSEDSRSLPPYSNTTISNFLSGRADHGSSLPALHAKAAIVFEQATRLAARLNQATQNMHSSSNQLALSNEFNTLDNIIESVRRALPPLALTAAPARLLVVHTLVHAATIRLHRPRAHVVEASRTRARVAAGAIVALVQQVDVRAFGVGSVDAILGTMWSLASQVFLTELQHARGMGPQQRAQCAEAVKVLLAAMKVCAESSRAVELQMDAARQGYAAATGGRA